MSIIKYWWKGLSEKGEIEVEKSNNLSWEIHEVLREMGSGAQWRSALT